MRKEIIYYKTFYSNLYDDAPKAAHIGEWIDLRAAKTIEMRFGDYKNIPLGIAMKLPKDYEAILVARSSTYFNYGIIMAGGIGVIDNLYSGNDDEWHFPAIALRYAYIPAGSRICQFRIQRIQGDINLVKTDKLDEVNRNGFGSTGTK